MNKRTATKGVNGANGGRPARRGRGGMGAVSLCVALVVVLLGLIQLLATFHAYALNLSDLNALKKQEASLVAQKQDLENDIRRWDDDAYVTAQARERLGYVFEGETPIRVDHPEAVTGKRTETDGDAGSGTDESTDLPWYSELAYSFGQADDPKQDASTTRKN